MKTTRNEMAALKKLTDDVNPREVDERAANLTLSEQKWLAESGRFVRMVVLDADGTRRCTQGIGCPKTSRVLGKARNGKRVAL